MLVRNLITNVARPARVIVLDPPEMQSASKSDLDNGSVNLHKASEKSTFFPSFTVSEKIETVNHQVAYLSYPLAFNIGLHVAWLDMLIRKGSSDDKDVESTHPYSGDYLLGNSSTLELYPFHVYIGGKVPKSLAHQAVHKVSNGVFHYAAHMRIAHIRTPASAANFSKEKDYLAALKKDRQERIDTALTNYFEVDRLVAIGDILSIRIPSPDPSFHASFGDVYSMQEELIHFKVSPVALFKAL